MNENKFSIQIEYYAFFFRYKSLAFKYHVPGSLVVRIPRSHRGGRGSIPRLGSFLDYVDTIYRVIITWKTPKRVHSTCIS